MLTEDSSSRGAAVMPGFRARGATANLTGAASLSSGLRAWSRGECCQRLPWPDSVLRAGESRISFRSAQRARVSALELICYDLGAECAGHAISISRVNPAVRYLRIAT